MARLEALPEHRPFRIQISTTVRKPKVVLEAYLASLAWQVVPPGVELSYAFVADFTDDQRDAAEYLRTWVDARGGVVLDGEGVAGDFRDDGPITHQWTDSAMRRVGAAKNRLIERAMGTGVDAIWFADADLMMDPMTLTSLYQAGQPIVTATYWTRWHAHPSIHAAPQVWLNHPYQLEGRGYEAHEFRAKLLSRDLVQVWGYGACTLIRREALEKGVNFAVLPDLPTEGMWSGEDRHFCVAAERLHILAYADNWPDVFHIYHPSDIARIPEMLARLGGHIQGRAMPGWLVSLIVEPLEPVPHQGSYARIPAQHVRGRLGVLQMLPELEEAILEMRVGETRIVPVHPDVSYPFAPYRGQRRLFRVTLVDTKPMGYPPVVEEEQFVGERSGRRQDMTTLSEEQHDLIREAAGG